MPAPKDAIWNGVRAGGGWKILRSLVLASSFLGGGFLPAGAQQPQPGPLSPPPASCDAACVRTHVDPAGQACAPRIEAEAPTDFEWLQRPYGGIFQKADPPAAGSTVVRYSGDSIRFLSPQKEWVRVTYECGYDVAAQKVSYVRVRLGRLDRPPAPTAAAPAAPRQQSQAAEANASPQSAPQARKPRPGEPSETEIFQVDPRRRPKS